MRSCLRGERRLKFEGEKERRMLEIFPQSLSAIKERIRPFAADVPQIWSSLHDTEKSVKSKRPFIQLSSRDLEDSDVDNILGYAGIPMANAPIGLPFAFESKQLGNEILIFPLDGLESYMIENEPRILQALTQAGSMDAFATMLGDEMTSRQYLVGGVVDCIRFCRENDEALVIHW